MIEVLDGSKIYLRSHITASKDGVEGYNPTTDAVRFGFSSSGDHNDAVWGDGSWETKVTSEGNRYYARYLYGSTVSLPPGFYTVFVHITDNPEVPVLDIGNIQVKGKAPIGTSGSTTITLDMSAVGAKI